MQKTVHADLFPEYYNIKGRFRQEIFSSSPLVRCKNPGSRVTHNTCKSYPLALLLALIVANYLAPHFQSSSFVLEGAIYAQIEANPMTSKATAINYIPCQVSGNVPALFELDYLKLYLSERTHCSLAMDECIQLPTIL